MINFIVIITFIILASTILWFIILSRGYWSIKFITIICLLLFSIFLYQSMHNIAGWPCSQNLPNKFILNWAIINENHQIILWITEDGKIEPRSYKIPYSREIHIQLNEEMKKIKAGQKVAGKSKKKGTKRGFGYSTKIDLIFYDLPPVKMLPKN